MSGAELQQITALSADAYEVVLRVDEAEHRMECTVSQAWEASEILVANYRPDLFWKGLIGDPRPVTAAVIAFHKQRRMAKGEPSS